MNVMKMMMRTCARRCGPPGVANKCLGGRPAPIRVYPIAAALVAALLVTPASPAVSQQQSQEARAELIAVTELGRLFGSIVRMHNTDNDLAVRSHQIAPLRTMTREVAGSDHLGAAQANAMIEDLRTTILDADQLEYIDGRTTSASPGSGTGSTSVAPSRAPAAESSAPANPLLDTGRQVGRFFAELSELLEEIQ